MQDILKIVALGICIALVSLIVKSVKPEFTVFILLSGCCLILTIVAKDLSDIVSSVTDIMSVQGINNEFCVIVLKISGVCLLCDFAADTCRDSGCATVANSIEMAGRICITASILPLALSLLETVSGIINSNVF